MSMYLVVKMLFEYRAELVKDAEECSSNMERRVYENALAMFHDRYGEILKLYQNENSTFLGTIYGEPMYAESKEF